MPAVAEKHVCTVTDANYLSFFLALHASVREHAPDWTVHVACLDETSHTVLGGLALEGLETIPFAALEEAEPGLTVASEVRPRHDFVMTTKPYTLRHALTGKRKPAAVTWLDADAMCFASLDPLLDELGDASVLLAPQGVPPAFRWVEERTGEFMGGLVTFRDDERGWEALDWWTARCLYGGCPRAPDEHRFSDQKYLRELHRDFDPVNVAANPGLWLAPSNVECHDIAAGRDGPLVDGRPVVLYQYTGFRLLRDGGYEMSFPPWRIGATERHLLYEPYFERVLEAQRLVQGMVPGFDGGLTPPRTLLERATGVGSRAKGTLHRAGHRLRSARGSR